MEFKKEFLRTLFVELWKQWLSGGIVIGVLTWANIPTGWSFPLRALVVLGITSLVNVKDARIRILEKEIKRLKAFDEVQIKEVEQRLSQIPSDLREYLRKLLLYGPVNRSQSFEPSRDAFVQNMRQLVGVQFVVEENRNAAVNPFWRINPQIESVLKILLFESQE